VYARTKLYVGLLYYTLLDYTSLRYVQFPLYSTPWTGNDTTWCAGGFMDTSNEFTILSSLLLFVVQKNFAVLEIKTTSLDIKSAIRFLLFLKILSFFEFFHLLIFFSIKLRYVSPRSREFSFIFFHNEYYNKAIYM